MTWVVDENLFISGTQIPSRDFQKNTMSYTSHIIVAYIAATQSACDPLCSEALARHASTYVERMLLGHTQLRLEYIGDFYKVTWCLIIETCGNHYSSSRVTLDLGFLLCSRLLPSKYGK